MKFKSILYALLILVLLGCATTTPQPTQQTAQPGQTTVKPEKKHLEGCDYWDTRLDENVFRIDVVFNQGLFEYVERASMEIVRNIAVTRAADIALSHDYPCFRILDSWSRYVYESTFVAMDRVIIIRLTNDPNDIDAQWILDTLGPTVGYEQ